MYKFGLTWQRTLEYAACLSRIMVTKLNGITQEVNRRLAMHKFATNVFAGLFRNTFVRQMILQTARFNIKETRRTNDNPKPSRRRTSELSPVWSTVVLLISMVSQAKIWLNRFATDFVVLQIRHGLLFKITCTVLSNTYDVFKNAATLTIG